LRGPVAIGDTVAVETSVSGLGGVLRPTLQACQQPAAMDVRLACASRPFVAASKLTSSLRPFRGRQTMHVRDACEHDADDCCSIVRCSICELCILDHQGDPNTLELVLRRRND